jgi:hypothetical protein
VTPREPEHIAVIRDTLRRFVAADGSSNTQKNDLAKLWGLAE